MSVRERLAALFRPRAAGKIRAPRPEYFLRSPWLHEAGVYVTQETATQVAAVYGCCRLIVDCLAPAPIAVTEMQQEGVRKTLHDDETGYTLNYGAPVKDAPDAPPAQAIEEALYWAALSGNGNGYAEIQRDLSGRFVALWPIESDRVTPRRDSSGYYYEINQPEGGPGRLEPMNMFHLRGPSLFAWTGDSTVYRGSKAIGIAQAAQVYSAAYFANGTVISGLLSSDKMVTDAQAERAKERWNESHKGPASAHGIAVTGQGLKYQPIGHSAQESQLVEARKFQVAEIARFFGVPLTLLGENEAWTNLSELYLGFYRNALRPWAERFDAEATRKLFPLRKPWREVQHDLTHLTLGSFKEQVLALVQATGGPIWTRNEARALFGKNSVPGGDKFPKPVAPAPAPEKKPDPERSEPDEEEDEEKPEKTPRREMNRAVVVMFARELDRYARKLKNRRADLKRDLEEAEIAKLRDGLADECAHVAAYAHAEAGVDLARSVIDAGAMGVEQGEPPDLAAARLLERATE